MSDPFYKLFSLIKQLRAPGGCPWDRVQTHASLKPYLIEEAYELAEVLDSIGQKLHHPLFSLQAKRVFMEEIGDVLFNLLLHCAIAEEAKVFSVDELLTKAHDKLVDRHPHVFGAEKANTLQEAKKSWENKKKKEKTSILEGLPYSMGALNLGYRIHERITAFGFENEQTDKLLKKTYEELEEFTKELSTPENFEKIEEELGDVFFSLIRLAYRFNIHPEDATMKSCKKFEKRFFYVERTLKINQWSFENLSANHQSQIWIKAKNYAASSIWGLTGGCGAGKSTARKFFEQQGLQCCDTDNVVHQIISENIDVKKKILERFNTLNRQQLREYIFNDDQARSDLESILHPLIEKNFLNFFDDKFQPALIYEASLLHKSPHLRFLRGIIFITTSTPIQQARIMERDYISEELAKKMIQTQTKIDYYQDLPLYVVDNSLNEKNLFEQLENILKTIHHGKF